LKGLSDYGSLKIGWVLLKAAFGAKKDQDWASEQANLTDIDEV
jgi:hypothetical protein